MGSSTNLANPLFAGQRFRDSAGPTGCRIFRVDLFPLRGPGDL